jgi:hypothetical protein
MPDDKACRSACPSSAPIWRNGKTRRLENITGNIASGVVAYLAGIRVRREALERFEREWRLSEKLRALAQAREEREKRRHDFVSRYTAILAEITELETFLELVQRRNSANGRGELARIVIWVNARLTPQRISFRRSTIWRVRIQTFSLRLTTGRAALEVKYATCSSTAHARMVRSRARYPARLIVSQLRAIFVQYPRRPTTESDDQTCSLSIAPAAFPGSGVPVCEAVLPCVGHRVRSSRRQ